MKICDIIIPGSLVAGVAFCYIPYISLSQNHCDIKMISAYNQKKIDEHLNCYATDARIDSKLAGGFLSKEEYRKTLQKRKRLPKLKLKDAEIVKLSPTKYQVDAILSSNRMFYISYVLIPLEARWVILEQRYR